MNLNEKIRRFISERDLTSTKFADEIGVPRPSISHILSDRNKPSLEIVQKMYRRYPELGFNWFLEEEEASSQNVMQPTINQSVTGTKRTEYVPRELSERKSSEQISTQANLNSNILSNFGHGSIARIMVVFTDGTIQEFKTSN
ncbi:helix-turn-helix domain protein [Emticicia oligotrophica DSM 17448]|uniref:Helix-turn-helix domain protein n=1 Tax=Emticicia oligotrophica (strain DSM 17448 / CIP 109782 / MTCC 6937 / GPTSA100-15) TaxID=929562 RepID=A0ABN4AU50_EMTOG|nr:helix-turn-helix transcriptional regulator [Emticicia oligotrophica]AFK05327.1 helix-turn-helix domain protein [Emticicia oligotrophica DSM 17448]